MITENLDEYLLRRLDGAVGLHARIARECGFSQAAISRYYLRKCLPTLDAAMKMIRWFEQFDIQQQQSGSTYVPRAIYRRRVADAATALGQ